MTRIETEHKMNVGTYSMSPSDSSRHQLVNHNKKASFNIGSQADAQEFENM